MRVLIVDDEDLARWRLSQMLQKIEGSLQIEEATHGLEVVEKIGNFLPEVVFLDIEMPGLTGFEVLASLPQRNFQLVFITAYQDYALKAFEECALDYILKPFSEDRLFQTWKRVCSIVSFEDTRIKIKQLEENRIKNGEYISTLALRIRGRIDVVDVFEISCLIWQEDYCSIYLLEDNREYLSSFSLKYFEERLDPSLFLRVNRNALVALNAIASFYEKTGMLQLKNKKEVQVSRRHRIHVLKVLS